MRTVMAEALIRLHTSTYSIFFFFRSSIHLYYRQADLIDISGATDIHGSKFDDPSNPIASKGKLDKSITPALYVPFVNFINATQLARFGIHNGKLLRPILLTVLMHKIFAGKPADQTLIDAKWESLALAPVDDTANPNDYFLFTAVYHFAPF